MIYLAIPYTGHEERSFKLVNGYAGMLMKEGHFVFSPISHTHPIAKQVSLPLGFEYWRDYDYRMIDACDMVVVLKMAGWEESVGVIAEIKYAEKRGIPILYRNLTDKPSKIAVAKDVDGLW